MICICYIQANTVIGYVPCSDCGNLRRLPWSWPHAHRSVSYRYQSSAAYRLSARHSNIPTFQLSCRKTFGHACRPKKHTNRNQTSREYTFIFRNYQPEDSALHYHTRNNVTGEPVTFVLRVKKLLVSNLGTETGYTCTGLSWFLKSS